MEKNCECHNNSLNPVVDAPYPPVKVQCCNKSAGLAVLDNIGGCNSEMTAVNQYLYNSLVIRCCDPELARLFDIVNRAEMHHLQIFNELAVQLGMDPRLWSCVSGKPVYWSPSCNQYSCDPCQMLCNAIKAEKAAIQKYQRQCRQICDPCIQDLLCRIIQDEQRHLEVFQAYLEELQSC